MSNLTKHPKSSRLGSDYFELLACQYICHIYNLTFSYSEDAGEINSLLLSTEKGVKDMKMHTDNFNRVKENIKEILENEIIFKGQIIKSIWIGRSLNLETTSDVDAKHITEKLTRLSLKSVKNGFGTGKNIGAKTINQFLDVDVKTKNDEMWDDLKKYLNKRDCKEIEIQNIVKENKKYKEWARENGKKLRKSLNLECFNAFNNLNIDKKIDFLNLITDNKDIDLFVIIVNKKAIKIYKPSEKFKFSIYDKIEAKEITDSGYKIYHNDFPIMNFQTNNTNGIGISSFCQRIFLKTI